MQKNMKSVCNMIIGFLKARKCNCGFDLYACLCVCSWQLNDVIIELEYSTEEVIFLFTNSSFLSKKAEKKTRQRNNFFHLLFRSRHIELICSIFTSFQSSFIALLIYFYRNKYPCVMLITKYLTGYVLTTTM